MTGRLAQARVALALRRRLRSTTPPAQALAALRRHAVARSPWYRQHHAGLEDAPLAALPVLTKDDVVEHLDQLSTAPAVDRDELDHHLATAPPGTPFRGLRVGVTSGSTGRPATLLYDRDEWVGLLANAARAQALGRPPGEAAGGRVRSAKVGSSSGWHLSNQVGATLADPRRPTLRLPATTPLPELVARLDDWAPDGLTAYPSVLGLLAGEALASRLHIAPRRVLAGGELLTTDVRNRVRGAWGVEVVDQYVLGEAGFVAVGGSACEGLHVLEEHVVVEVVDEAGNDVPDGEWGDRVLLTVLPSRTIPLIRYEVHDRARWLDGTCPCGRATPRLAIDGRARAVLQLAGPSGEVTVHPSLFSSILDAHPVGGWQVVRDGDGVSALVTRPRDGFDAAALERTLTTVLAERDVTEPVRVSVVDDLDRGPGGKAALVVDHRRSSGAC